MQVLEAGGTAGTEDSADSGEGDISFDWLSVGGAAFPGSGPGVELSQEDRRWEWTAPEAPWTVGRRVEAEFYGAGSVEGPLLWNATLEPGQDSGQTRSGYGGSVSCDPYGRLYDVETGGFGAERDQTGGTTAILPRR